MSRKIILLFFTTTILCSACSGEIANSTATPDFFTATLPPTSTPQQATQPPALPSPPTIIVEETTINPVEGMTTTQVNIRAEPSTASTSLGIIGIFSKTQIVGRDASGSWYQILYGESAKGWVRAEYVQVNAGAEIPLVEVGPASGAAVGGMVTQKVNVRSGPGTEYESLGMLSPNDLISITGRDVDDKWIQIEFAGAPDGRGWITAEYAQAADVENAPLIGAATEESPTLSVGMPATASPQAAMQDGDSMQSPLAVTVFSPTGSRSMQVRGDISAPDGDAEDWIQFKSNGWDIAIEVTCPGNTLHAEVWNNGSSVDNFSCGARVQIPAVTGNDYFLRLIQNETGYTDYTLRMEITP